MSKNVNIFWKKILTRTSLFVVIGVVGLIAFICGPFIENKYWHTILSSLGQVLLIGVVFNFIMKAPEFLDAVKGELADIIYGKKFLNSQKNIDIYWETVSKQMFQYKFEGIHEKFLNVLNAYLPKDEVSYYSEYQMYSKMEWENEAENIVKVVDEVKFTLIAETEEEFIFPLKNWIHVGGNTIPPSVMKCFSINDKPQVIPDPITTNSEGTRCEERQFTFKGSKSYKVHYVMEKVFNFDEDHTKGFKAKYIVNNCRVVFDCPDNIVPQFESRGTLKEFDSMSENLPSNRIDKKYLGILLPQQGFLIALQKKNKNKKQHKSTKL